MPIVMPDSMTAERRALLKAYGAALVLTPGAMGMKEAVRVAAEAEPWAEPPPPDERAELVAILSELDRTRPQDAELVRHRLRGRKWRELSDAMGVSEEALRQRWSALMSRLRERCAAAVPPTSRSVTSRRR
jgi:DNA-directed RNA polymerase specialized sigma24 family protein